MGKEDGKKKRGIGQEDDQRKTGSDGRDDSGKEESGRNVRDKVNNSLTSFRARYDDNLPALKPDTPASSSSKDFSNSTNLCTAGISPCATLTSPTASKPLSSPSSFRLRTS
jgi:hypothetical protein